MRELEQFRLINQKELIIIDFTISKLNPKLHDFLVQKSKNIYINLISSNSKNSYPSIFLISDELNPIINHLSQSEIIFAAGLYFGFIKKSEFYLSLEAAEYFYNNNLIPKSRLIIINKDGEKSILYGNDITKAMIFQIPNNFQTGEIYIVINELNELLALATATITTNEILNIEFNDIIARTIVDKGKYLREKQ